VAEIPGRRPAFPDLWVEWTGHATDPGPRRLRQRCAQPGVVKGRAPRSRIWAVVKANAYGTGSRASRGRSAAADGLALIELEAAIELRRSGEKAPHSAAAGSFLFSAQELSSGRARVPPSWCIARSSWRCSSGSQTPPDASRVLKLNTGMNRSDSARPIFADAVERLGGAPGT